MKKYTLEEINMAIIKAQAVVLDAERETINDAFKDKKNSDEHRTFQTMEIFKDTLLLLALTKEINNQLGR